MNVRARKQNLFYILFLLMSSSGYSIISEMSSTSSTEEISTPELGNKGQGFVERVRGQQ